MDVLDEPLLTRHRLSVEDYDRMAQSGVLSAEDKIELIDGDIIDMPPMGSRHWSAVMRLLAKVQQAVADRAVVACQGPLRLSRYDEPEPDIALVKYRADYYRDAHPAAADTLLVIEVAETSALYDREITVPLYARHGVPEVWIVDPEAGLLRFYRQPSGERYTDITATETPGPTPVVALPGIAIDLTDVL
jgi:Uma2 family endonuclease